MTETKTYTGGCHCGKVRYEVVLDLNSVYACNCSICSKRGWLLAFATPDGFKLLQGGEGLTDYQFNKKIIHHLFCPICGVASFGRGEGPQGEMVSINVRCLDDVDVSTLPVIFVDGKSF